MKGFDIYSSLKHRLRVTPTKLLTPAETMNLQIIVVIHHMKDMD